jgi:hypothetical protein
VAEAGVVSQGDSSLAIEVLQVVPPSCFSEGLCRARIAPVLVVYPSSTGAQRVRFAMDGYDGYATWAAGRASLYFWSRARPEIDHLSGLFVALPQS